MKQGDLETRIAGRLAYVHNTDEALGEFELRDIAKEIIKECWKVCFSGEDGTVCQRFIKAKQEL